MCPSEFQGRLVRAFLRSLGSDGLRVSAGPPEDFEGAPRAEAVILDSAFGPPHTGHPWAKGPEGAKKILAAFGRAKGAVILLGSEGQLEKLAPESPLGALFRSSGGRVFANRSAGRGAPALPSVVSEAKESLTLVLPPMEPLWWAELSPPLFAAAVRGVRVAVFTGVPPEGSRELPGNAIRELRAAGAAVHLAQGFPGFMAVTDSEWLHFGFLDDQPGARAFRGVYGERSAEAARLAEILLQLSVIRQKLGPGAFRSCPLCGWPYLIVNQDRSRGFGDLNSLKLGCASESCALHKKPRPLDERWPFASPPLCRENNETPYQRVRAGRLSFWVCPKHPEGPCPSHRVLPGDAA
jgi:hypothetical protein